MHTHVPPPPPAHESAFVPIPLKAVTYEFTGMPKKSVPYRDGWTWKLFRDMAVRASTTALLRRFVELFVNGLLPKPLWNFLSSAIMIPFHKLAQMKRILLTDPSLKPITIGALLRDIILPVQGWEIIHLDTLTLAWTATGLAGWTLP